ncbi:FAD binding domain-containing protein [Pseudonocardia acidicola]|uniref:Xanthine dehydrogenase family protein subunit M n=1 Tax=Pseudonocardia acidicola TaxID=2724939 RepID=A0ABX1S9L6_9PSEU|nr:xanthine dehydrogenase family protein subunit M [Pseudonocardia acidicola]
MREFGYRRAPDVATALALAGNGARYLAGGTNLVDLMKLGVETPSLLVDVTRLPLDEVEVTGDGGLLIGAMVRNSDLAVHPQVRRRYPAVTQAILSGASGQLRNMATVGGNLLQRTRCPYFADVTKPCNKRAPGTGCPARTGEHHNLAILGASEHCIATNPSDLGVTLAAFDAVVHVQEAAGPRTIPLRDFHRLPGDTPDREVTMAAGALITGVGLPALPIAAGSRYRKVRDRASYAFATASIAAAVDVADGRVRDVRIGLGAVAPVPWRAHRAEEALRGGPATADAFAAAADAELAQARPLRDNAYKVELTRNLIVSELTELAGVAP